MNFDESDKMRVDLEMITGRDCACPTDDAYRCIAIRYNGNKYDEECECSCHDRDDADYMGEDYFA